MFKLIFSFFFAPSEILKRELCNTHAGCCSLAVILWTILILGQIWIRRFTLFKRDLKSRTERNTWCFFLSVHYIVEYSTDSRVRIGVICSPGISGVSQLRTSLVLLGLSSGSTEQWSVVRSLVWDGGQSDEQLWWGAGVDAVCREQLSKSAV